MCLFLIAYCSLCHFFCMQSILSSNSASVLLTGRMHLWWCVLPTEGHRSQCLGILLPGCLQPVKTDVQCMRQARLPCRSLRMQ
uniref:Putative secreted protein n=1 Tax=Ixodes ricinus TaxID=34613 RepID=A0A6B0TZM6_IXORI